MFVVQSPLRGNPERAQAIERNLYHYVVWSCESATEFAPTRQRGPDLVGPRSRQRRNVNLGGRVRTVTVSACPQTIWHLSPVANLLYIKVKWSGDCFFGEVFWVLEERNSDFYKGILNSVTVLKVVNTANFCLFVSSVFYLIDGKWFDVKDCWILEQKGVLKIDDLGI